MQCSVKKYATILQTIAAKAVPKTNYIGCGLWHRDIPDKPDEVNLGLPTPTFT
jgi:hypothetical protein